MGHYDNCRDDHIPEVIKMVLVPREPTPEMRRAANDCAAKFNPGRSTYHIGSVAFDAQSIYRAMVDAAPQPSQSENISALRERLGGIGIDQMGTDNLAISLATYFDDGEEPNEHPAWSDAAINGANALLDAIHAHYEPILSSLSADNERLKEERDALLAALGFKPGPMGSAREVILKDAAGLRPEMVRARTAERALRSDRDWDRMAAAELLRKWVKRKFGRWITWRTAWAAVDEIFPGHQALSEGEQT